MITPFGSPLLFYYILEHFFYDIRLYSYQKYKRHPWKYVDIEIIKFTNIQQWIHN